MHTVGTWVERETRDENTLVLVYDWVNTTKRDANENIFTAQNLQAMCRTEHVLLDHKDYDKHCQLDYTKGTGNVSSICQAPKGSIAYQFYDVSDCA